MPSYKDISELDQALGADLDRPLSADFDAVFHERFYGSQEASASALDALLAADGDEDLSPGFDTRFHARLRAYSQGKQESTWGWWRSLAAGLVTAAAIIAFWLVPRSRPAPEFPTNANTLAMVMELDLLEAYDLVRYYEGLEEFALLQEIDPQLLDAMEEQP